MSLQNALNSALLSLRQAPPYSHREILVLMAALSTVDPGDIFSTINVLKGDQVRCSVVSLSAELYVCSMLAKATKGIRDYDLLCTFFYLLQVNTIRFWIKIILKELFWVLLPRNPSLKGLKYDANGWRWDFRNEKLKHIFLFVNGMHAVFSVCVLTYVCSHDENKYSGYLCPRCKTRYCELPTDCSICSLTLVSSAHLARSYHHLFPIASYVHAEEEYIFCFVFCVSLFCMC